MTLLILDRLPINKYSVLTRFRLNLLAKNHALIFAKSLFILFSISNNDLPHADVVSSANILTLVLDVWTQFGKSFI